MREFVKRPTIGVLITWPAYHGTTFRRYLPPLLQGMHATAIAQDCNLLLACDIGLCTYPRQLADSWPSSDEGSHFIPVGPWNTDGLIVVADVLSPDQSAYLAALKATKHPIVFAGFSGDGPSVVVDNAGGIRQAFNHLRAHGHTRIAYIAGFEHQSGDSLARFQAYHDALRDHGLPFDPRLVAYGQSTVEPGQRAMRQILERGVSFTAVLAHNDGSCIGAMEALREAGLRIPEDIAVIGFDDFIEARALTPSLTTIHHPTFALGSQAVRAMLDVIAEPSSEPFIVQIPTRLIIRRSCGCRPGVDAESGEHKAPKLQTGDSWIELTRTMADATLLEVQTPPPEIESACRHLIEGFSASLRSGDGGHFIDLLIRVLREAEARGEDAYAWQSTLSALHSNLPVLLPTTPDVSTAMFANEMLDQARRVVAERVRRQTTHALVRYVEAADLLGLMTAELLAALDESQIPTILAEYLPRIGISHMQVARFEPSEHDPAAQSTLVLSYGLAHDATGLRFTTRQFPPPALYPPDRSFQLALLPLAGQPETQGFVAFDAANLEPCAVIARNLAAALRSIQLYAVANEARSRAEAANQLKSRFLSMVSHELRTPLNLILGLSEMVLREQKQSVAHPDGIAQDIKQIYTSAQHLGQLIGDVLDLASSEAGQLRLLHEPVNLAEVLQVVALTGEQMVREKGLAWRAQLPAAGPWVLGDRTRLRQIVLNLISNAVKFTSQGSVTLEVVADGDQVTVSITDTGLGVPIAEQERIFDEFQRGERTSAHGYDGLGLGLAICKQLVALQNGVIGVRSSGEEGNGATFYFTLPTIAEPLVAPKVVAATPVYEQSVAFLTESARAIPALESYLADRGQLARIYRVDAEADWLQRLLAGMPAIILLDSQLALSQGWQILAALERHPVTRHIPLVVYSYDSHTQQGALLELNYQRKPLDAIQLAQLLDYQGVPLHEADGTTTVLVVDDEPGILDLHTRLLREAGHYRVIQARNGREALAVLRQTRPALVLLDLLMPELDGFAVLEAMRVMEQTRDVPVVVLTAQTLTEAEMERLNQGLTTVLSKGVFSTAEIVNHIDAVLARTYTPGGPTQRMVHKALAYIHDHYAEPLNRTQIARYVGVDENYLTECFRQRMGVPPMTYLTRYRIKQAQALLAAGIESITEVALAVGFASGAHFSRVFQREVGVPPSAYRRGVRPPT